MNYDEITFTAPVQGIPIEWFYEINRACDRYFKRKGIVWQPLTYRQRMRQFIRLHQTEQRAKNK